MNKPAHPHRWFSAWRAAPRPAEDDPADYGTAFGLELSLEVPPPAPVASTASRPRGGWMPRWAMRRKPAT